MQPLRKIVWRLFQKLRIEVSYDPAIQFGYLSKANEIISQKDACTLMFTAALFTIAKTFKKGKQPEFIRGRIDKECDIIYICVCVQCIYYIYI